MDAEINNFLTLIECTLLESELPDYIEVSYQNGSIYILLSKEEYVHYKLHERIQGVFGLLQFEHEDILEEFPVIIECLTPTELSDLFRLYGKKYE